MRLYTSVGPNPRIVRMFAAEKDIRLEERWIDLAGGENRRSEFLAINPAGQLPVLEIAPKQFIAETTAICEYLEETCPGPMLLGKDAHARAEVRMWTRRVEESYCNPLTSAFRYGPALSLFRDRVHCIPQAAGDMAEIAREGASWIDAQLASRDYLTGGSLSLADIVLYCFMDFAQRRAGQSVDGSLVRLHAWFRRVDERASAQLTAGSTYKSPFR